ncbi:hypothetical protein MKFW12EY_42090 [Methylomonas koyamae]|nr:hypothetical protein MKFW12EY_42090 [Methylomonas koyamae]
MGTVYVPTRNGAMRAVDTNSAHAESNRRGIKPGENQAGYRPDGLENTAHWALWRRLIETR